MPDAHHPIQLVSRRSGLSMHVIRIWEQRYHAVEPQRTPTNRRLYTQQQIDRLTLLREVTEAGFKIGQVARMPTEKLRALVAESAASKAVPSAHPVAATPAPAAFIDECVVAIKAFDAAALEDVLKRAAALLGALALLQRVVAPLTQALGELWRDGSITAAHEHFATAVIRVVLGNAAKPFSVPPQAPMLVVATPVGQVHELGALLVAASAANFGWSVTYLGANLPAAEIAGAAQLSRARALALSLVYPADDPQLADELKRLREALPTSTAVLVGGRAMPAYYDILAAIGAIPITDLTCLGAALDDLRTH